VPGDIISVKLGDIILADARLLEGDPLKIDQVMQIEAAPLYVNWVDVKLKLAISRRQASNPARRLAYFLHWQIYDVRK